MNEIKPTCVILLILFASICYGAESSYIKPLTLFELVRNKISTEPYQVARALEADFCLTPAQKITFVRMAIDAFKPRLFKLIGHSKSIRSLACSSSGRYIASGSSDQTVKIWNILTGEQTNELRGHTDAVLSVAFSSDETSI